jgi:hypothetical protein
MYGSYGIPQIIGNSIYSNQLGIDVTSISYGTDIKNNLIYSNLNQGIRVAGSSVQMVNNTIYQLVGNAIRVENNSSNVSVINNIIQVDAGYALSVASDSQQGFRSDYNLFNLTTSAAFVGIWNNAQQANLTSWKQATGQETNSLVSNPLFLDIDGADNVLGEQGLPQGNGNDDNFGLSKGSPAIDRANAYVAPLTDIANRQRRDDPGTANGGRGWGFAVSDTGNNQFAEVGVAQNWRSTDTSWTYNLPFTFEFYGVKYNSVQVSSNGFLQFAGTDWAGNSNNSRAELDRNVRIAPLWDNIRTDYYNNTYLQGNIYIDNSVTNQVTIRWQGQHQEVGGNVNVAVTLFADGSIRFNYGAGNEKLNPTIGISAGLNKDYLDDTTIILADYDSRSSLNLANSILWTPTEQITFFDIGAYEFQGDSNDSIVPVVTGITNIPENGGTTDTSTDIIGIQFSEVLDSISALSQANYSLVAAGRDDSFNTNDDIKIEYSPVYNFLNTEISLQLINGLLPNGAYRLTIFGDRAFFDTTGNKLDGDNDGRPGGNFVHTFTIRKDRPPTVTNLNLTETYVEDEPLDLTDMVISDADSSEITATLTLSDIQAGILSTATSGSVTSTFIQGVWRASGAINNANALLANLTFIPSLNYDKGFNLAIEIRDDINTVSNLKLFTAISQNDAPVFKNAIADQTFNEDTPVNFIIPANTFSDVDNPTLNYTATLADDTALPTWLSFNPTTLQFSGTPPANFNGNLAIKVTASDGNLSASDTFTLAIAPVNDAPEVKNAIAGQHGLH